MLQHRHREPAHRVLGCRRGVGVAVAGPPVHLRGERIDPHLGQHLAGGRFADRPGVSGVRGPLCRALCDVIGVGLAHRGQCGAIVDQFILPRCTQIPSACINFHGLHS